MPLVHQVLGANDIDEIFNFASHRLELQVTDLSDRMFASWVAPWRKESLEHYLKLGWSFVSRHPDGKTAGFFLGQPIMFFRGQTQNLWIEHVDADSDAGTQELVDIAVRVAREKHLQRAIFANWDKLIPALEKWNPEPLPSQMKEPGSIALVRTTKG